MKAVVDLVKSMCEYSESEDESDQQHDQDQQEAEAARLGRAATHCLLLPTAFSVCVLFHGREGAEDSREDERG